MTQVIDFIGGEYENRTRVHGFAIRCVTTPPTRRSMVFAGYSNRIFSMQVRKRADLEQQTEYDKWHDL